jgi:hypothetical protein
VLTDLVGSVPAEYPRSLRALCALCEDHGGRPLFEWSIPGDCAYCTRGEIILSAHSNLPTYREAILHELVHRIAPTERWEHLNREAGQFADRRLEFLEALATDVGCTFASIAATGTGWA